MGAGASTQWPPVEQAGPGGVTAAGERERGERERSSSSRSSSELSALEGQQHRPGVSRQKGGHRAAAINDPRWCCSLRKYVEQQYGADVRSSLAGSGKAGAEADKQAEQSATLAKSYLMFWLETTDLEACPPSAFRALRTDEVCERYLRIGAKFKVPFNQLVQEEVLISRDSSCDQDDSDSAPQQHVFAKARAEALEYLESEVLPFFYSSSGPHGFKAVKRSLSSSDRTRTLRLSSSRSSSTVSEEGLEHSQQQQQQSLSDWLEEDPRHPGQFRAYLQSSPQPELAHALRFCLDSRDFRLLHSPEGGGVSEQSTVLLHFNDLYDQYLLLGTDFRSQLPTELITGLVQDALGGVKEGDEEKEEEEEEEEEDGLDGTVLDKLRVFALQSLARPFERYQREVRGDVHALTMEALLQGEEARREGHGRGESAEKLAELLLDDKFRVSFAKQVKQNEPASLDHALHFHLAARDFEQCVSKARQAHTDTAAINASHARKLYEEYLRYGSPREMDVITAAARRRVLRGLQCPPSDLFSECQQLALRALAAGPLSRFSEKQLKKTQSVKALLLLPDGLADGPEPVVGRGPAARDVPLSVILQRHEFCRALKRFAEEEFLLVPILFWFEASEFMQLPREDLLRTRSRKILRMYVLDSAPRRFALPKPVVAGLLKSSAIPGPAMFIDAQKEAFRFMNAIIMPKFRDTGLYKMICMSFVVDDLEVGMPALPVNDRRSDADDDEEDGMDVLRSARAMAGPEASSSQGPSMTRWGGSSSMPLRTILHSSAIGLRFFKDFCNSRHQVELLLFWIEANDFRLNVPGQAFMALQARKIVKKYIGDGAKMKVKLRRETCESTIRGADKPGKDLFQKALEEAFEMLQSDLYPPFLASEQHEKMMELLRYEPLWSAIKRRVSEAFDAVRRRSSLALGSLLNLQQQQGPEYSLDSQRSVRRKSGATEPARRVSLLHAPDRNAKDRTG